MTNCDTQMPSVIVNHVLSTFKEQFPEWMDTTVLPYLDNLQQSKKNMQFNFSSLLGETQQGKTLVMHLITWIMIYVYNYTPCYITKKLSALRDDALGKLSSGAVNKIVDQVCQKLRLPKLAKEFYLRGVVGLKAKGTSHKRGDIPVFLMQPENNLSVLRWMSSIKEHTKDTYPVYFIDEVHELYSVKNYLQKNGLSLKNVALDKIHNHSLIHMIADVCKRLDCGMLGITATPHRMLTSDPEVYPSTLYNIPCMPPKDGLIRIGYSDQSDEFQGAEFHNTTDVVKVIDSILDRKQVTLSDGRKQVKFLNIVWDHYNCDMAATYDMISKNFSKERVYVKLFIQSGTEYDDINVDSLDQFFDIREVPDTVLKDGLMILIGKSREAAGITIKPSFPLIDKGYHLRIDSESDSVYEISGITDMLIKLPGNMETAEQLFGRASGWYDANHQVHFWMKDNQIQDVRTGVVLTKRGLISRYDGTRGPTSLLSIQNMCTSITKFSPNNHYSAKSEQRGHISIAYRSNPPDTKCQSQSQSVELHTDVHRLPQSLYQRYREVCRLPGRGRTTEGREVHRQIKDIMKTRVGHSTLLHIPWDTTCSKVIYKSAAQPQEGNNWKVNAYVKVDDNSLVLVSFLKTWQQRPYFGYNCSNCNIGGCTTHFINSGIIYWTESVSGEPTFYQHASYAREMKHKYISIITQWTLSDEHAQVLNKISEIVQSTTVTKRKTFYNIFTRLNTLRGENTKRPKDILHQTWISGKWNMFKEQYQELHDELDQMIRRAIPGKESELIPIINRLMEPYFLGTSKVKKIKARLRIKDQPVS